MKRFRSASALSLTLLLSIWGGDVVHGAPPGPAAPGSILGDIDLRQVRLDEAARMVAQAGGVNVVVSAKAAQTPVTLYLRGATVDSFIRTLARVASLWHRYDADSRTYFLLTAEEFQRDIAIARDEQTRIHTLRHYNVVSAANAIQALFGKRVRLSTPVEESPPTSLGGGSRTRTGGVGGTGGNRAGSSNRTGSSGRAGASGNTGGGGFGGGFSEVSPGFGVAFNDQPAAVAGRGGASAGGQSDALPRDLSGLSVERALGALRQDESGQSSLPLSLLQELPGSQGAPIHLTYNKLHNLLIARSGDERALDEIERLLKEIDRPARQVLLELKILEVTLGSGFTSAFDLDISGKGNTTGPAILPDGTRGNYPSHALSLGNFGKVDNATGLWQIVNDRIRLNLQLLESQQRLRTLGAPTLIAYNNQPARLFIGDEQVLVVGASSQSVTGTTGATTTQITVETETRDVGQSLSILPRINEDGTVSLTIDQDNSAVKKGETTLPIATADGEILDFPIDTVNTAAIQVTALAKDGMTVAIGGLVRATVENVQDKVPLLGDLPLLGALFRSEERVTEKRQLLLLVTPRVLRDAEEAQAVAQRQMEGVRHLEEADLPARARPPATPHPMDPGNDPGLVAPQARTGDDPLADLARAAAARLDRPHDAFDDGLHEVAIDPTRAFLRDTGRQLSVRPLGGWQRAGHWVAALEIANLGKRARSLGTHDFPGAWLAVALERSVLAPAGAADSRSRVYLISDRPFDQALSRVGMAYRAP
ncbi:MAG TPA: hypothetical protein PKH69_05470 [Thiobacillaceae bacterium]|nr:hypothetical protein [Thiobacillaceae bacterium]HNU64156.1 hypothetical protein [Thiobacillaceae bacterium]